MPDFRYAAEQLRDARSALLLPEKGEELWSIRDALLACYEGLEDLRPEHLDDERAKRCYEDLHKLLDTRGIPEHTQTVFYIKAQRLTRDERVILKGSIDSLADWLTRRAELDARVAG